MTGVQSEFFYNVSIYIQPFHILLKPMTAARRESDRMKQSGIMNDIPKEIAISLAEAGGIPWLCSLLPSETDLADQAVIHKALSDPSRLKILHLLSSQPLCVCVIKHCLHMADSKLSYHLLVLREAGLVESHHDKNWLIYNLTDEGKRTVVREETVSADQPNSR
jgi:DNA-binding transcriptional ArsR family regulator